MASLKPARSRHRRRALISGLFMLVVMLLAVNTVVTDRETKSARADIGRIVALPGPDLQVREDGPRTGSPIVLLHGSPGSIRWWDRVVPLISPAHRVIRIDLPGHGGSAKPRGGYGIPAQAHQLWRLLDRFNVGPATLVGFSYGGIVATAMVEARRDLVSGLFLIGVPTEPGDVHRSLLVRLSEAPVVGELLKRFAPDASLRKGLQAAFANDASVPDAFVDDVDEMTFTSFTRTRDEGRDYLSERRGDERLRSLGVPLVAVAGSADEIVDPAALKRWRTVPRARTRLIQGGSHTLPWERPQLVAKLILELDRRSGGPRLARIRHER
jgi:pimeloyl-ACP methyl ester carboxylesterase